METVFMLLREGPNLEGLPEELRPLIESCMQMDATQRPTPADLQAQLAPHLFDGGDDSGTASAWLPGRAVAMIEARRAGQRTAPAMPVPRRPSPGSGAGAGSGSEVATHRRPRGVEPYTDPRTGHAAPPRPHHPPMSPAPSGVPVRLGGSPVPIGPGPRASAVAPSGQAAADSATGWVRPPGGSPGAALEAAPGVPGPASGIDGRTEARTGPAPRQRTLAAVALPHVQRGVGHPDRRR
ncbi:hypothetical protein GCM10020254_48700 [Streptomyces goshikiensis]